MKSLLSIIIILLTAFAVKAQPPSAATMLKGLDCTNHVCFTALLLADSYQYIGPSNAPAIGGGHQFSFWPKAIAQTQSSTTNEVLYTALPDSAMPVLYYITQNAGMHSKLLKEFTAMEFSASANKMVDNTVYTWYTCATYPNVVVKATVYMKPIDNMLTAYKYEIRVAKGRMD